MDCQPESSVAIRPGSPQHTASLGHCQLEVLHVEYTGLTASTRWPLVSKQRLSGTLRISYRCRYSLSRPANVVDVRLLDFADIALTESIRSNTNDPSPMLPARLVQFLLSYVFPTLLHAGIWSEHEKHILPTHVREGFPETTYEVTSHT